jgi:3-methyladenine DNA glycosylase AlkD
VERDAIRRLRALADPGIAASATRFFKPGDAISLYGVKTAAVRRVAGEIFRDVRSSWLVHHAITLCEILVPHRRHEAKLVGMLVVGRFRATLPRTLLGTARRWIRTGHLANWAAIDALCAEITAPLVGRHPDLAQRVVTWSRARDRWIRRAAAVTFVPHARHGAHLDHAYAVADRLMREREDLVQKACGWLLKEAGTTDVERLVGYLKRHGSALPRTTLRYAIERFPPSRRRHLLHATRSRPAD